MNQHPNQRPPLRKKITIISENSLEYAAVDQFDQLWGAQNNQNNIDEWDDTGIYDQIIKK